MAHKDSAVHNDHNRGEGLRSLADWVLAHRRIVMIFWLVLFIVGGAFSGSVQKRLSPDFSLPGQPGYEVAKEINAQYGNGGEGGNALLVINLPEGVSAKGEQARIDSALATVRQEFPKVRIVDFASTGDASFITKDGRTEYAMLFPPKPVSFNELPVSRQVADKLGSLLSGAKVTATGEQELAVQNNDSGTGVFVETLVAGLGALAVLAFVFASFLALIPLMVAAVSILTTLLIVLGVTYLGEVSFIVLFLVSLVGLGVAIDYSLLIVTRWREELAKGADNTTAIRTSMATAGHAVLLSGLTVAIGLLALIVLPVPSLRSIGYGGMLIPLISVAVCLTLLPAILSGFGKKMNWPKLRQEDKASRAWTSWARGVVRFRWASAIIATALLIVLIIPVSNLKIGVSNSTSLAKSGPAFDALKSLTTGGVDRGVLTPMEVLVDRNDAAAVATALRKVEGMGPVWLSSSPDSNKGSTSIVVAVPKQETTNSSTIQPVKDARALLKNQPGVVGITGSGPIQLDYIDAVFGNALLVFAIIGILTFILLARAFHSVVLALKALALNVVSLAAIFGLLTWFWQEGHLSNAVFNVEATGSITFWIPTMVFAFLFGLSMDYEVFIIARMREEYDRTGSTEEAVVVGIGRTGRLVTSAALILFMSFASLALSGFTDLKVLATGLGAGILLDATIVRAFLLPALVALFGDWNWYMPKWLATALRTELPVSERTKVGSGAEPAV